MGLQTAIPVDFDAYFPRGAFMVGEVEPVAKWSDDGKREGQDLDKHTGHPLWPVRVIDADPDARKGQNEVSVKISSVTEPQAPPGGVRSPIPADRVRWALRHSLREGDRWSSSRRVLTACPKEMKAAPKTRGGE